METKHILVIDDESDIREVIQASLETTEGWVVHTAPSGREGLAMAAVTAVDAILLDVMMPEMDGPTTLQHLQADPALRPMPVILLTAKVQASDRRRFAELGVQGVIAKPFDPLTLGKQMATILGWGR
jgi:CheY-like chemotaxis protein